MTTNITTLAINLLISERKSHRSIFAERIIELIYPMEESSELERELKNKFISVLNKCVEDPTRESGDVLYQLAYYYNEKINGAKISLPAAA